MEYEEFAADLLRQHANSFASVEENEEAMRYLGVAQEIRQLGGGAFRSDLLMRSTKQADFYADRFSKPLSAYLEAPPDYVGILLFQSVNGDYLACGNNVANNKLVFLPAGAGMDITAQGLSGSDALGIPEGQFSELIEALYPGFPLTGEMTVFEGNANQLHTLDITLRNLLLNTELEPSEEQVSDLIAAMITWIGDSAIRQKQVNGSLDRAYRMRVAKQVQEYIHEHYTGSVPLESLCRLTGVEIRTLQRYFRGYFGMSVREYLKVLRLDAAHRDLYIECRPGTTVAQVAFRNGFSHLGRFSVDFHARFGELASQVLTSHPGSKTS